MINKTSFYLLKLTKKHLKRNYFSLNKCYSSDI